MPALPRSWSTRSASSVNGRDALRHRPGAAPQRRVEIGARQHGLVGGVERHEIERQPGGEHAAAASGSTWMLNSAVGVTLPGTSTAPPITTTRASAASAAAVTLEGQRHVGERAERDECQRLARPARRVQR